MANSYCRNRVRFIVDSRVALGGGKVAPVGGHHEKNLGQRFICSCARDPCVLGEKMLTFHVGLTKTGSTALQIALSGMSRGELRGVHYRGSLSAAGNDGFVANGRFQVAPRDDRTPTVRLLKAGHHVVLSHEVCLGHPWLPDPGEMHRDAIRSAVAMRDYFQDKTELRIVIYVRPQHQWLESLYNQYAKRTTPAVDSTEFAERAMGARYFHWTQLINDLKGALGPDRLIIRPYQPGINVTTDFLTILGLPTPQRYLQLKPENSSLTGHRLALQTQLGRALETTDRPSHWALWATILDTGRVSRESNGDYSMFTEDIQSRLIEFAARDWERLSTPVADTHLADPHQFRSVAQDVEQAQIKPYFGSLNDGSVADEAVRLLAEAIPYVRTHPRNLPTRVKGVARMIRAKAQTDPKELPRAVITSLRRGTY